MNRQKEFYAEILKDKEQPTEYVAVVPEVEVELEINMQYPKKHR